MKKISNKLAKNILATVVYYDILDYPLTLFELWKYLIRTDYFTDQSEVKKITIFEITKELETGALVAYIHQKQGFYFLKGRSDLIQKRINNNKISKVKLKKLSRVVWIIKAIPFVRMVGVTGKLAMKNANLMSDWDLLIILKEGKIWTGRTLVTILMHLIGKRRHGKKIANRVCLNYFITDASMEIITKDLFSANEYMFLFPLYGWKTYQRFQLKNKWIRNMKPLYDVVQLPSLLMLKDSYFSENIKALGERLLDLDILENYLRKIEKKKIMQNPKTKQEGSLIHAYDDALIFLPNPHGPVVFEKFKQKLDEIAS